MARPKSTGLVKLYELKRGDKFYDADGIACQFIDCKYDATDPNKIEYRARALHHRIAETRGMHGPDVSQREFFRFRGRDRSSYMAGFIMAIQLCSKNMGKFDLENAEIDTPVNQHMTMMDNYKKWKKKC